MQYFTCINQNLKSEDTHLWEIMEWTFLGAYSYNFTQNIKGN